MLTLIVDPEPLDGNHGKSAYSDDLGSCSLISKMPDAPIAHDAQSPVTVGMDVRSPTPLLLPNTCTTAALVTTAGTILPTRSSYAAISYAERGANSGITAWAHHQKAFLRTRP